MKILFRRATINDCLDLFNWRNDEKTRRNSFNTEKILLDTHKQWLKKTLENPLRELFILSHQNRKIGTIRFDKDDEKNCAEISITIAPEQRGKGYSSKALKILTSYYLSKYNVDYIFAEIKLENELSKKVFLKAGFNPYKKDLNKKEYRINR